MSQKEKYILALDQGTTSSRAMVFNHAGATISVSQKTFKQYFPNPGWVEHEPNEIWSSQASVAAEAIAQKGIDTNDVVAVGITNQRETTIIWDRHTGQPIYRAIVWQDRRTSDFCNELNAEGYASIVQEKTGLIIDAYFSASKIKWILDNVPGARARANNGDLMFGTVDTWLLYKFSKHKVHFTDVTNASRTMLFNIHTLTWDDDLLRLFDIPACMLPEVKSCSEIYCNLQSQILSASVPISGVAGDQQAALFGQLCLEEGMLKTTYGTGCFMVLQTGKKPIKSDNRLLTTIAWNLNGEINYALEGSVFVGGAVIQWLRDGMGLLNSAPESESLAASVADSGGVYFVPAMTGLGAPYWNQEARGAILGITRGTTPAHITRAALESIAFQVNDVLKSMESDMGVPVKEMRIDGGAVANNLLVQFQSDISRIPMIRPKNLETTALGAAYFAGLGVGFWKDVNEIKSQWQREAVFKPLMEEKEANLRKRWWNKAVSKSLGWLDPS